MTCLDGVYGQSRLSWAVNITWSLSAQYRPATPGIEYKSDGVVNWLVKIYPII